MSVLEYDSEGMHQAAVAAWWTANLIEGSALSDVPGWLADGLPGCRSFGMAEALVQQWEERLRTLGSRTADFGDGVDRLRQAVVQVDADFAARLRAARPQ